MYSLRQAGRSSLSIAQAASTTTPSRTRTARNRSNLVSPVDVYKLHMLSSTSHTSLLTPGQPIICSGSFAVPVIRLPIVRRQQIKLWDTNPLPHRAFVAFDRFDGVTKNPFPDAPTEGPDHETEHPTLEGLTLPYDDKVMSVAPFR